MRHLAVWALVASVSLAQEGSDSGGQPPVNEGDAAAKELVKKVFDKANAAKTLTLKFTMEVSAPEGKGKFDVEALWKDKKARVEMSGTMQENPAKATWVCDGKKLFMTGDRGETTEDVAEDWSAKFRTLSMQHTVMQATEAMKPGVGDMVSRMMFGDFKFEADEVQGEKKIRVVTFIIGAPGTPMRFEHKVWIDEEGLKLVRHDMKSPRGHAVSETYATWEYDKEILDAKFEVK